MGSVTTEPQIQNLIGGTRKNKRSAREARTSEQFRSVFSKTTSWNYLICGFDDNLTIKRKSLFLRIAIIVNCETDGMIAKYSKLRKSSFLSDVFLVVAAIIAEAS